MSQGFLVQLKCVAQLLSGLDLRFCSLVLFYQSKNVLRCHSWPMEKQCSFIKVPASLSWRLAPQISCLSVCIHGLSMSLYFCIPAPCLGKKNQPRYFATRLFSAPSSFLKKSSAFFNALEKGWACTTPTIILHALYGRTRIFVHP